MSAITRDEVERIAGLARLELSEGEAERMAGDLATILDYVEALQALDTSDVEPTANPVPLETPLRDDRVRPGLAAEVAVAGAPHAEGTAFVVPKVIEGEEG